MQKTYKEVYNDFKIEITADAKTEEQQNFIEALGHMVIANISLMDTKLLNTCINLLNQYSKEVLSNIADFVSVNDIEVEPSIREKLEDFSNANNFTL